ncbi:MAG TPA: M20/M25/M40 family metallo-hydrolase [Pyrinomonadaceae bacterium]
MLRRFAAVALVFCFCSLPAPLLAQQPTPQPSPQATPARAQDEPSARQVAQTAAQQTPAKDPNDPIERIKDEGMNRSQVMQTLSYLTDVIGPRLTASPGARRANEWTRETLAGWGLANAHLEAWGPFGRGWTLQRFSAQVTEPQAIPLIAYPKAWSPGTHGTLTANVVYVDVKTEADLVQYRGKLKGAIVLTGAPVEVKAHFDSQGHRLDEKDLLRLANAPDPRTVAPRRFQLTPEQRAAIELSAKKFKFFHDEGAALLVDPSRIGDGGTIFVQSASVPQPFVENPPPGSRRINAWDKDAPRIIPQIVVSAEHYNRMIRMLQQGQRLKMAVDLAVQFQDADPMGYNTVAEIPGSDLKDELIMLGGHMDSWHSGTGATDNAAGVAVAMEAVRILQALKLQPRRTIRIALWTGEEQGLLGSRAYVAEHFGKFETPAQPAPTAAATASPSPAAGPVPNPTPTPQPKLLTRPDYEKFSAYFNLDNGTGKIRGVYMQGNEQVRPLFRQWLMSFKELGAETLSIANTGGTDHLSYDAIGLPGFQFIQDNIEYETRTHHSNQDVYDRIQAEDMKQAAVIMAAFIYRAAMMDEKMPRKPIK